MAEITCNNCGKKFDYEINSGMCPHCSTYNRKGESKYQDIYKMLDGADQEDEEKKYKASKRIMITLIISIVLAMIATFAIPAWKIYTFANSEERARRADYYIDLYGKTNLVTPIEQPQGEYFFVNDDETIQVRINDVSEVDGINKPENIPEGEKVIAISITEYAKNFVVLGTINNTIGKPYIGYDDYFKETFDSFQVKYELRVDGEFEDFEEEDVILQQDNTGYVYALVPEDATECDVYIDVRDADTMMVQKIYKIPVSIEAKE